jgi:hypothetical protein
MSGLSSFIANFIKKSKFLLLLSDFSSTNQTNHVILCALPAGDTIWLTVPSLTPGISGSIKGYILLKNMMNL